MGRKSEVDFSARGLQNHPINTVTLLDSLCEIEQRLDQHVKYLRDTAVASPPGGGLQWDQALAFYQVQPDSTVDRLRVIQGTRQHRGASTEEFRRVMEKLAAFAKDELSTLLGTQRINDAESRRKVDGLHDRINLLATAQGTVYASQVGAAMAGESSVGASVGGIFANAINTAKLTPWSNIHIDPTTVTCCKTCGAPQEKPLDFKCRYCRQALFGG